MYYEFNIYRAALSRTLLCFLRRFKFKRSALRPCRKGIQLQLNFSCKVTNIQANCIR